MTSNDTQSGTLDQATAAEPRLDLLVHRMTWEADGVLSVDLVHPDGKPLPAWQPGAHLDLHVGGHTRQYSLCGDPLDTTRYRLGVLNEPASRGGSRFVHTQLRPGQTVTAVGPRNHFALADAPAYLFIAGGIGITPLLAMAREATRKGVPWRLVHGGRSRASMAFGSELADLATQGSGELVLHPQDEHGHIDLDAALSGLDDRTLVYCCGPEPLLAAVEDRCPATQLRVERFAAPTVERSGDDSAFEVECRRSGTTLSVGADTSILEAAEAAGLQAESSCRDGICGSCETRVLEGVPDHRDFLLSEAEHAANATMMICVSRCASDRLVLDL
ncbi:PDR/VanB family oxidoreductase [Streptomyces violens]|uniref:PDR/VanB family oxidoreductase n=1 Tax=Streptomyces violens TaxID=66377 RepID=UPI0006924EE7|nr:PDR/VanB family oxidoreductase [Streptomyces violens]